MSSTIGKIKNKQVTEGSNHFLLYCYQSSIDLGEISTDPYQKEIILELQKVFNRLLLPSPIDPLSKKAHFFRKFIFSSNVDQSQDPIDPIEKGLYIWGGVGRGKTHLVNYFYQLLPIENKLRLHFHRFMELVHEDLNTLKGTSNPLEVVAKNIANKARLLCLDEMHVNDITDAMLLSKLFTYLFKRGVVLVTTSNVPPHHLYKNGLQRDQFIPAINTLKKHIKVVKIKGTIDYRQESLDSNAVYYLSSGDIKNSISEQRLETYFNKLSGIELHQDRTDIIINDRKISVRKWADGIVWFDFKELCNTPRSTADYSHIAKYFHTVLISDIPIMNSNMDDVARRFVNLIDIFYDMHTNIVISALTKLDSLYTGNRLAFEFLRTTSRIKEMQSEGYTSTRHFS